MNSASHSIDPSLAQAQPIGLGSISGRSCPTPLPPFIDRLAQSARYDDRVLAAVITIAIECEALNG
jgi:hypothetical protein